MKKHLIQYKDCYPIIFEVLDRLFVDDLSCSTDSVERPWKFVLFPRKFCVKGDLKPGFHRVAEVAGVARIAQK